MFCLRTVKYDIAWFKRSDPLIDRLLSLTIPGFVDLLNSAAIDPVSIVNSNGSGARRVDTVMVGLNHYPSSILVPSGQRTLTWGITRPYFGDRLSHYHGNANQRGEPQSGRHRRPHGPPKARRQRVLMVRSYKQSIAKRCGVSDR